MSAWCATRRVECVNALFTPTEVHEAFARAGLPRTAELFDWLVAEAAAGRELQVLGSSSLDFEGVCKEEFTLERALRLQELHLGNRRLGLTAVDWLSLLARRVDEVPRDLRRFLDLVTAEFLHVATLPKVRVTNLDADLPTTKWDDPFE